MKKQFKYNRYNVLLIEIKGDSMNLYQNKLIAAKDAVKLVKSNDWVDYGIAAGVPYDLDRELAHRVDELENINIRATLAPRDPEVLKKNKKDKNGYPVFTWNSWHMGGIERKRISDGCVFYSPIRFSEMPRYYRENIEKVDVAMFQVSPMDEHGYFSFGPCSSYMMAMCEKARIIIVEVNKNMPRCLGGPEEEIHISEVDYIVEGSNPPMPVLGSSQPSTEELKIANLLIDEIPNGACLQLGIGGMPNTVGKLLAETDIRDLGVHSEMYVDGFLELALKGKINGSKKNIDRFKETFTFALGSEKLYEYINNNPRIMCAPVDYVNDARVITQLDNFISVNNAVEVDLFGQVCAESSGTKHISGAGGQLDFVLGAYLSRGGKSFICLTSTYSTKEGQLKSRIVPTVPNGSIVTDTRANTHFVVTEYGKVNLKGLSTWQRAEALISISNPIFRDELIMEAEKMKIWRRSNK